MIRARDVVPAVVLAVVAVAALVGAARLPIGTVKQPGPGFFPLMVATGLLVASLALVVQGILPRTATRAARPAAANRSIGKAVAVVAALLLYVFVMGRLGFTVSTVALLLFLFLVVAPTRWVVAACTSVVAAFGCLVLFKMWLGLQLPAGPWGF